MTGIDGSDNHLLYPLNRPAGPSWSPDGTKLIFATPVPGIVPDLLINKAIIVNATGAPDPHFLLPNDPGGEAAPAFSPDGQSVIFRGDYPRQTELLYHIVPADGSTPPVAFEQTPIGRLGLVWSPDNDWFYFVSYDMTAIYRASTDPTNQSWSVVTSFVADSPNRWSLSPQGDRIAFTTNASSPVTAVVNVDGTNYRQITTAITNSGPVGGCYSPVWSPNGADVIMHCYIFPNLKIYRASSTASSPVNPILIGGGQSNEGPAVYAGLRTTY